MKTIFKKALITLMFLLSSVAVAAADYCINVENFITLVGKGFSPPDRGVCNEFQGGVEGTSYWAKGEACGSQDGIRVLFTLFVQGIYDREALRFFLDRKTLKGNGRYCVIEGGLFTPSCTSVSVEEAPCRTGTGR